ncbi:uncharacterized protein LOC108001777 [Apis cerana]|uniref:Coiled-coil domain-containing protein 167 n=1 Tax=Apis cerana cerana TaxID=94128 RepID=A0A2A3ERA3_APICC|nr:uncharacterized protein LOC108001777 [Apis cerana]PBC33571.1 hypothetical protein APICC_00903 [Apis cerana cerana]
MTQDESIITKIQKVEDTLNESMYKLDMLTKKLKTKLFTMETREELETQLEEIKEVLKKNEEKLKKLRKQNTKSFMVAASIIFACFLLYGLYLMFYGTI